MRYTTLPLVLLLLAACNIDERETTLAPSANFLSVVEYSPAPGQFVNDTKLAGYNNETTPEAACAYAERRLRNRDYVTLGGWGGYLVVSFAQSIINDGGYNLLVEGNTMSSSSEPGVVWVMSDENKNGLADDMWYELRGSEFANSRRDYQLTYTRPTADSDPVVWSDNQGNNGTIDRTPEHPQSYFPAWYKGNTRTFVGSLLPKNVAEIDGLWIAQPFEWGYVDNYSQSGRNIFRIDDAVDSKGAEVKLTSIDFVKIQCAVLDKGPLIGEVSTEVTRICNYNLLK